MESTPEPEQTQSVPVQPAPAAAEEVDETWEEKEDKLDAENIEPEALKPGDQKYQYKEGTFTNHGSLRPFYELLPLPALGLLRSRCTCSLRVPCPTLSLSALQNPSPALCSQLESCPCCWHPPLNFFFFRQLCCHCHLTAPLPSLLSEQWKPINPEEKKKYDREFLLGFQFISASMHKPEGLPQITEVVLDKVRPPASWGRDHLPDPSLLFTGLFGWLKPLLTRLSLPPPPPEGEQDPAAPAGPQPSHWHELRPGLHSLVRQFGEAAHGWQRTGEHRYCSLINPCGMGGTPPGKGIECTHYSSQTAYLIKAF